MLRQPPLIARLRRRLALLAWLCAFVVLAKGALISTCLADGIGVAERPISAALDGPDAVAAHADGEPASPCWHAGSGGCHCTCAHSAVVPATTWSTSAIAHEETPTPSIQVAPPPRPPIAELRPPIA